MGATGVDETALDVALGAGDAGLGAASDAGADRVAGAGTLLAVDLVGVAGSSAAAGSVVSTFQAHTAVRITTTCKSLATMLLVMLRSSCSGMGLLLMCAENKDASVQHHRGVCTFGETTNEHPHQCSSPIIASLYNLVG